MDYNQGFLAKLVIFCDPFTLLAKRCYEAEICAILLHLRYAFERMYFFVVCFDLPMIVSPPPSQDDHGCLRYLDTSIGKPVAEHRTRLGALHCMAHNPHNAIVHLGHQNGEHVYRTALLCPVYVL